MVTVITKIVAIPEIKTETIETDREIRISKVNAAIAVREATTGVTMFKGVDAIERQGLKRTT